MRKYSSASSKKKEEVKQPTPPPKMIKIVAAGSYAVEKDGKVLSLLNADSLIRRGVLGLDFRCLSHLYEGKQYKLIIYFLQEQMHPSDPTYSKDLKDAELGILFTSLRDDSFEKSCENGVIRRHLRSWQNIYNCPIVLLAVGEAHHPSIVLDIIRFKEQNEIITEVIWVRWGDKPYEIEYVRNSLIALTHQDKVAFKKYKEAYKATLKAVLVEKLNEELQSPKKTLKKEQPQSAAIPTSPVNQPINESLDALSLISPLLMDELGLLSTNLNISDTYNGSEAVAMLRAQLKESKSALSRVQAENERLKNANASESRAKIVTTLYTQLEESKLTLMSAQTENEQLKKETTMLRTQLEERETALRTQLEEHKTALRSVEVKLEKSESIVMSLHTEKEELEDNSKAARTFEFALLNTQAENTWLRNQLKDLKEKQNTNTSTTRTQLEKSKAALNNAQKENEKLKTELETFKSTQQTLETTFNQLEGILAPTNLTAMPDKTISARTAYWVQQVIQWEKQKYEKECNFTEQARYLVQQEQVVKVQMRELNEQQTAQSETETALQTACISLKAKEEQLAKDKQALESEKKAWYIKVGEVEAKLRSAQQRLLAQLKQDAAFYQVLNHQQTSFAEQQADCSERADTLGKLSEQLETFNGSLEQLGQQFSILARQKANLATREQSLQSQMHTLLEQHERIKTLLRVQKQYGHTPERRAWLQFAETIKPLFQDRNYRLFISYCWPQDISTQEIMQANLRQLQTDLKAVDIEVWLDLTDMSGPINQAIQAGLNRATVIVIMCTPDYGRRLLANPQGNLAQEFNTALKYYNQGQTKLIPIIYEGTYDTAVPQALKATKVLAISQAHWPETEVAYCRLLTKLTNNKGLLPTLLGNDFRIGSHSMYDKALEQLNERLDLYCRARQLVKYPANAPSHTAQATTLTLPQGTANAAAKLGLFASRRATTAHATTSNPSVTQPMP